VHIYPSIESPDSMLLSGLKKTKKRDGDFDLKNKFGKYGFGTVYNRLLTNDK
jgi:hypothetical protein